MMHPDRSSLTRIALAALLGMLMVGCSDVATKDIEAERVSLHGEPINMNARDLPEVSIEPSGAVKIGDGNLALTDAQRALTRDYRDAVVELVDQTLDDAARVADHAASRVLLAMLVGRADEEGEKIGKQAEAIAHSPQFCGLLGKVQQREARMVQSVTPLQPYAKLSQQDVDNCVAGKPYKANF